MTNNIDVQSLLFEQIKSSNDEKLVDLLCDNLNISIDAAYRRIRNEKLLTIDEVVVLCKRFNLSIDNHIGLVSKTKLVPFSFPFSDLNFDFKDYLKSILLNLKTVQEAGGTVYFSAKDVPMFHCFQLKELSKFKLFYWMKTMLSRKDLVGVKFSEFELDDESLTICQAIADCYAKINSIEIWNYETIHGLTSQISYYKTIGFITPAEKTVLLDEVSRLLKHLQIEAELGKKFLLGKKEIAAVGDFKLLFNEVLAADNSIYAEFGNQKATFIPSIILNYITTYDEDYCNYIKSVFESVMKKSTLISEVNEKDRSLFFTYNFERIEQQKNIQ